MSETHLLAIESPSISGINHERDVSSGRKTDDRTTHRRRLVLIEPTKGWQLINVSELWKYRELLGFLVWRDVKVRYKQTLLGVAWAILQPAVMMVVMTMIFSRLSEHDAATAVPYPLYVYIGLLPWTFFSTAVAGAANSVIGSERLITRIYFPRLTIPFSAICAAAVDWAIATMLLVGMMIWYRIIPSTSLLLMPVVFCVFALFAAGLGTMLSALNVAYRDFRYVVPFVLQAWMFATPAIYLTNSPASNVGRSLLALNPLNPMVSSFRAVVLGDSMPWSSFFLACLIAIVTFLAGCLCFRRMEDGFSDVI